jgi:hypothetical protein
MRLNNDMNEYSVPAKDELWCGGTRICESCCAVRSYVHNPRRLNDRKKKRENVLRAWLDGRKWRAEPRGRNLDTMRFGIPVP